MGRQYNGNPEECEDLEVFATWVSHDGNESESIGSVELCLDPKAESYSMPDELEINGYIYKLEA